MTYREAYEYGKKKLIVQGILEAELDARLLLEHVCGKDRNYLLVYGNEDISTVEENSYFEVIEKRGEHIPLQHITGIQEFMGLKDRKHFRLEILIHLFKKENFS